MTQPVDGYTGLREDRPEMRSYFIVLLISFFTLSNLGFVAAEIDKAPTWTYSTDGPAYSIAILSDGSHTVAGTQSVNGGTIYYLDKQGNLLWKYGTDRHVWSVAVSDDGQYIAAAASKYSGIGAGHSYAGLVYLFDNHGNLLWKYDTNQTAVTEVKLSEDGSFVAVDRTWGISYLNRNGSILWIHNNTSINDHPVRMAKDGSLVATKDYQTMRVFDRNGTLIWTRTVGPSSAFGFSNDGRYLVTSADPSGINMFDREGNLVWANNIDKHFTNLSFSSDGSYIVASAQGWGEGNPGGIFLFDNHGNILWEHQQEGSSAISSDGSYVCVGQWIDTGPSVVLFNRNGDLLWQHAAGIVTSIAISQNGRYVIAGIVGQTGFNGPGSIQLYTNDMSIPEFPSVFPILLIGITSLIIFYRMNMIK